MPRELVTLPGVDILATGEWRLVTGPETFTSDDLADAIDAATCPSVGPPRIKLGHVDPRFDGEPAVGRVANMRLSGNGQKITADLTGMPAWLGDVAASAYPNRSIEGRRDWTCQQGHLHPFVISAVALLGVTAPAVGVLNDISDIPVLFDVAASAGGSGQPWKTVGSGGGAVGRRHVDGFMAALKAGRIVGERAIAAMFERAVDLDRAEREGRPVAAASAPVPDDGEMSDEVAACWAPGTFGKETDRRVAEAKRIKAASIAASRPEDSRLYEAVFHAAGGGQGTEETDTTHTVFSGTHSHSHSDYQGGAHTHSHVHAGDALHDPATGGHVQLPNRSHPELGNGLPG